MDLFAGLDTHALDVIVRAGRTRRVARGRVIFRRGDEAATCHALVSGRVRIAQPVDGTDGVVMRYVGPGEMFGAVRCSMAGDFLPTPWRSLIALKSSGQRPR